MKLTIILAALLLSGCSTLDKHLSTRLHCSAAADEVAVVSWWGPLGFATRIDQRDKDAICKG